MGMLPAAIAIARRHIARADADDARRASRDRRDRIETLLGRPSIFEILREACAGDRPDLSGACGRLGIAVEFRRMQDGLAGWIECDPPRFVVDVGASETKRRLMLAHHLAHWLYDRDIMRAHGGLNDRHGFGSLPGAPFHNPDVGPEAETRANRMAVQLLMPADTVRRLHGEGLDPAGIASRMAVTTKAMLIRLKTVLRHLG